MSVNYKMIDDVYVIKKILFSSTFNGLTNDECRICIYKLFSDAVEQSKTFMRVNQMGMR
jgi:hypothetical protein